MGLSIAGFQESAPQPLNIGGKLKMIDLLGYLIQVQAANILSCTVS